MQVTDAIIMNQEDVLLRERFFTNVALEGPVGVHILFQAIGKGAARFLILLFITSFTCKKRYIFYESFTSRKMDTKNINGYVVRNDSSNTLKIKGKIISSEANG